jgi:hypothetical protein
MKTVEIAVRQAAAVRPMHRTTLLKNARGLVMDVKSRFDRTKTPPGIELWRL